jgi:hypothetical protein
MISITGKSEVMAVSNLENKKGKDRQIQHTINHMTNVLLSTGESNAFID